MLWAWKDELPARRLVCVGKHLRGWPALVSLAMLPHLYALTGRAGSPADFRDAVLTPLEHEIAEAVLQTEPPVTAQQIRRMVHRRDAPAVNRAINSLQRNLILTRAGTVDREQGWPAIGYDLLARRYGDRLAGVPAPEPARRELAAAVLRTAGELTADRLARILALTRAEAAAALAQVR